MGYFADIFLLDSLWIGTWLITASETDHINYTTQLKSENTIQIRAMFE